MSSGQIEVNTLGLLLNTVKVVIIPVVLGILLSRLFPNIINKIKPVTPFLAVLSIVFIVDFILAIKKKAIMETGGNLIIAIIILHTFGFVVGYLIPKLLGLFDKDIRAISIEVGMQNSGLATELARNNFPLFTLATVPGAISALVHCILGSLLAGVCLLVSKK